MSIDQGQARRGLANSHKFSVIISALGGAGISVFLFSLIFLNLRQSSQGIGPGELALVGAVWGGVVGFSLRRTDPPLPWWVTYLVAAAWALSLPLGFFLGPKLPLDRYGLVSSFYLNSPIVKLGFSLLLSGALGGLVTSLLLFGAGLPLRLMPVVFITVGWTVGWLAGFLVFLLGFRYGFVLVAPLGYAGLALLPVFLILLCSLSGAVGGAIGSTIMFGQLGWSRSRPVKFHRVDGILGIVGLIAGGLALLFFLSWTWTPWLWLKCPPACQQANLSGADLRGKDLNGADLGGADLRGADLRGAQLTGTDLAGARLAGAVIDASIQLDPKWQLVWTIRTQGAAGRDLREADLTGADLSEVALDAAILTQANLGGANLSGAHLGKANLEGANLCGANLSQADLHGANLNGASLCLDTDLTGTVVTGASLCNAGFSQAKIDSTTQMDPKWELARQIVAEGAVERDLNGQDLSDTNLHGANLKGANLSGANLRCVDLSEADLSEANLSGAILTEADVSDANFMGTTLSDGTINQSSQYPVH
ncbi:MAG: pentapeptide repeat-containing protein [Anaerolineae bacterium]|nr:pentapeptide repeat-containing protein [Anaerolineae bacterium]